MKLTGLGGLISIEMVKEGVFAIRGDPELVDRLGK
jgi:hypothetical protein